MNVGLYGQDVQKDAHNKRTKSDDAIHAKMMIFFSSKAQKIGERIKLEKHKVGNSAMFLLFNLRKYLSQIYSILPHFSPFRLIIRS